MQLKLLDSDVKKTTVVLGIVMTSVTCLARCEHKHVTSVSYAK